MLEALEGATGNDSGARPQSGGGGPMKQHERKDVMNIHPAADIFPMMSDDELRDLAADIEQNGLLHPIMTDSTGELIVDGRNRFAACKLAGVKPKFEKLNGHDPLAYIVSANLARRNLSKGQQAMAMAMVYPEGRKGGRGNKNMELSSEFSAKRLAQARYVLRYSMPLAQEVMSGKTALNDAIEVVRQHEQQTNSKEAQLARLREQAPDLAELVAEERLTIPGALGELNERNAAVERIRQGGRSAARDLASFRTTVACIQQAALAGERELLSEQLLAQIGDGYSTLQRLLKGDHDNDTHDA